MTHPSKGIRARTRNSLSQKPYMRPTITKFLKQFKEGQHVVIIQESSSTKGRPHARFKGTSGYVIGTKGKSYIVQIKDRNMPKKIIARPEHLKAL